MISDLKLSIIICTHRRFKLLQLAVQSLCYQNVSRDVFEVIIVDNDYSSNKEVVKIVEEAKSVINISYLHESIQGLSQARNAGGLAALADYVGYIDDDAKVPLHYVVKCIEIIEKIKPDIIGGPYNAFFLTNPPIWYKNEYGSDSNNGYHGFFNSEQYVDGMNMVFKKNILHKVGWFDLNFGMDGKKIWYGEETMVQIKAWQINPSLKVWYDKELYVEHLVPDYKMSLKDKFQRSYNMGKSQAYMWISTENMKSTQQKAPFVLSRIITSFIIKILPNLFLRDKKKYPFWQNYAYEVISKYYSGIGQEYRRTKDYIKKYIKEC